MAEHGLKSQRRVDCLVRRPLHKLLLDAGNIAERSKRKGVCGNGRVSFDK
jgi:hypothetical protein